MSAIICLLGLEMTFWYRTWYEYLPDIEDKRLLFLPSAWRRTGKVIIKPRCFLCQGKQIRARKARADSLILAHWHRGMARFNLSFFCLTTSEIDRSTMQYKWERGKRERVCITVSVFSPRTYSHVSAFVMWETGGGTFSMLKRPSHSFRISVFGGFLSDNECEGLLDAWHYNFHAPNS